MTFIFSRNLQKERNMLLAISAAVLLVLFVTTNLYYKQPKLLPHNKNFFEISHEFYPTINFDHTQSRIGFNAFAKTTESLITYTTKIITTTTTSTTDTTSTSASDTNSTTTMTNKNDLRTTILVNFCNSRLGNQVRKIMMLFFIFKNIYLK